MSLAALLQHAEAEASNGGTPRTSYQRGRAGSSPRVGAGSPGGGGAGGPDLDPDGTALAAALGIRADDPSSRGFGGSSSPEGGMTGGAGSSAAVTPTAAAAAAAGNGGQPRRLSALKRGGSASEGVSAGGASALSPGAASVDDPLGLAGGSYSLAGGRKAVRFSVQGEGDEDLAAAEARRAQRQ